MEDQFKQKKFLITGGSGFIGSNLINTLYKLNQDIQILNLDKRKPTNIFKKNWLKADLNFKDSFYSELLDFNPDYIVHLAADTTMDGENLDDYKTNILGVRNLLDCCNKLSKKTFLIAASSQHVKKPGTFIYSNKEEYSPLGLYGESKVLTEKIILESNIKQNWLIIRPTLVWGPNNIVMANSIFNYMNKGLYFHPSHDNTVRSYGYVENLSNQILKLLKLNYEVCTEKIIYLADHNMLQKEWLSMASDIMFNSSLKTIPKSIIRLGSLSGEYIKNIYSGFPLYMERFRNLTTSNPVPLGTAFSLLGKPKIDIEDAMRETGSWLKTYYKK